jgi:hypothetical protein
MRQEKSGCVAIAVLATVLLAGAPSFAAHLCKAQVDCPANFNHDTVYVADSVVMLSEIFAHCSPDSFREGVYPGHLDTISLFFIIDHSASMSVMDSTALRYRLVRQLIDSLAVKSPASEVGLTVFSNQLLHNHANDPYFVTLDSASGWPDAYVPLTRLQDSVNGVAAPDKIKWAIQLGATPNDTDYGGNRKLVNGYYGMTGRHSGHDVLGNPLTGYNGTTDITLAFEAAKKAFKTARYPREHQFIIFLSDGVHQFVDVERRPFDTLYINGDSTPTTFTAFFINQWQSIPDQIFRMTEHIRINGYSSRNSSTDVWKTQGSEAGLINRLITITAGSGQNYFTSTPKSLTINGTKTTTFNGDLAVYTQPFVLTGEETPFTLSLDFQYDPPLTLRDTLNATYIVKRAPGPIQGKSFFEGIDCWEQGTLDLYYGSNEISVVQPNYNQLQVRFYPPTAFPISDATLVVKNAAGTDSLTLTTTNTGTYFSATFNRELGSPAIDNVLQNGMNDSVIVYYRNPAIPLDIVRLAVKVIPARDLAVTKAYYLDQAGGIANGQPDVLRVEVPDALSAQEVELIRSYIHIQSTRGITITAVTVNSKGFDIILSESTTAPLFTGVYSGERLYIDEVTGLTGGSSFPLTDVAITDSMAPVIAAASLFDAAGEADTLEVSFSEPVKTIGSATPFEFMRPGSSDSFAVRLSLVDVVGSKARFTVVPVTNQTQPLQGDSIWINIAANVSDTLNVRQDAKNIRQALTTLRLFIAQSAAYADTNADGLIDVIHVTMDRPPTTALLAAMIPNISLPTYRKFQYTNEDFVITPTGFDILVTQPAGTTPFTKVDDRDKLVIDETKTAANDECPDASLQIADIMAPVITKAIFKPKTVTGTGTPPPDTLVVTFSEAIPVPHSPYAFVLTDSNGVEHKMQVTPLSSSGATQTFLVDDIANRQFVFDSDSIRINPTAGVADSSGNIQNDPDNRNNPLQVGEYHYLFTVKSGPNPFNPLQDNVTIPGTNLPSSKGMAIVVEPKSTMADNIGLRGSFTIYDCLGNVIVDRVDGKAYNGNQKLIFFWDGTNRNGRYVASGSYLAMISIEDTQKHKEAKKVKIGVKR